MEPENISVLKVFDPLRSKIPLIDFDNPLSRRCIDIITEARLIWGYNSIPSSENEMIDGKIVPKKKSVFLNSAVKVAIDIDGWYRRKSLLFLRSGFQADNALLKTSIEDCREGAKVGENISDQQICAIFAICEALDTIRSIQQGKPEEATKEKVLSASTFLNLAKAGLEPEKQAPASTPKVIPFPTPSGTQWHEVKISFIDNENVRISIKGKTTSKNYVEMGFKGRSTKKEGGKTSVLWTFFRKISQVGGSFAGYSDEGKVKIKELFSDLRKKLTLYFQIEGDPIPYIKGEGYRTSFTLENKSYSLENEDSIRKQNTSYVPLKNKHTGRKGYEDMT